ncbi:MAG: DUF5723 family protein [Bacteroidetes bacterium]|nr:DUF5723 family protein [Bacteroidota bacterium]
MKKIFTLLLFLFACFGLKAQEMLGIANSNYAGTNGLSLNPSNFVENRNNLDINLLTFGFSMDNDYLYFPKEKIAAFGFKDLVDLAKNREYSDAKNYANHSNRNFNLNLLLRGPSATFHIASHWFGIQSNLRFGLDLADVNYAVAKFGYEPQNLHYAPLQQQKITADPFSIGTMLWRELAFTYGHKIYQKDKHYLKGAITVKRLASFGSAWVKSNGFQFEVDTNPNVMKIYNPNIQYGYSYASQLEGLGASDILGNKYAMGTGWGFDFGITYEYRPKFDDYRYEMDGQRIPDPTQNSYKLRVGLSVTDVGFIHFDQSAKQFDLSSSALYSWQNWDVGHFQNQINFDTTQSVNAFDTLNPGKTYVSNNYDMGLPRALSVQVDYSISKSFYADLTWIQRWKRNTAEVTAPSMLALTPRLEADWIEFALPMSYYEYSQFRIGFALRIASFIIGSDKFGSLMGLADLGGMDVYTSLKFSLDRKKIKDSDNDGVSNKKDLCPKDKGSWATMGCPDRDHDGIADKDDECPDVAGLAQFHGCPDSDNDGIPDKDDECPTVAGLPQFHGCPDTDGDGIPDNKDDCPAIAGLPQFNGCPDTDGDGIADPQDSCPTVAGLMQFHGCPDTDKDGIPDREDSCPTLAGLMQFHGCPDTDGDGIIDPLDSCPLVAGPESNHGCPVIQKVEKPKEPVKVELTKEEQEVINKVFKNLEFETAKAIIRESSFASLSELSELLKKKTTFKLLIDGHTDNVGGKEYNQKLSQARAEAVKKYLGDKGIDGSRITAKGYGLSKPIASNKTPEGRQRNRRVEFTIVE